MAEKLEFDLTVKNNSLDSALDQGAKKAGMLENALSTALGVFGGGIALKGFDAVVAGIGKTIDFAEESVKAYAAQEDSLNKLRQALRAAGDESESSFEDLSRFTDELGRNSKQSSEAIAQQLAFAKSLGLSNDETKELVQAAANLSATFGGALETNVQLLGKSLNGTAGKLAQFIPELRNLTAEQLAAGAAADIINSKFNGAAAAELDSYSGRVFALSNAYEDIKKQVGGLIANSDAVKQSQSGLTSLFQEITQAISDWRIEQERQNEGFKETESSLDQLKRKYIELQAAAAEAEDIVNNPSMFDTLLARPAAAADNLKLLNEEIRQTGLAIAEAQNQINADKPQEQQEGPSREVSPALLEARKKANAEILNLKQQLILEENNLDIETENQRIQDEQARNAAELERITNFALTKTELEFQLKEQELMAKQDGIDRDLALTKLANEKELALMKIKNDAIVKGTTATREAEKKAAAERIALQQATASTITGIIGVAANVASVLAKEGSKELFLIQKAAALAQAIVAMNTGIALANIVPPPGNVAAAAAAKAQGAIAISGILATAIKGFAEGGIIGGNDSGGASAGPDNTTFQGRKGEMVLTADDQKMLLEGIRSGNFGTGDLIIEIDGVAVFKAVRNQIKKGYKLA